MADKDVDGRGDFDKDVDGRGDVDKDVDGRGGAGTPADLVDEIVSRASALGGWLIVSIVSPLPLSGRRFAPNATARRPSVAMRQAAKRAAVGAIKRSKNPAVAEPAAQRDGYRKSTPGASNQTTPK